MRPPRIRVALLFVPGSSRPGWFILAQGEDKRFTGYVGLRWRLRRISLARAHGQATEGDGLSYKVAGWAEALRVILLAYQGPQVYAPQLRCPRGRPSNLLPNDTVSSLAPMRGESPEKVGNPERWSTR